MNDVIKSIKVGGVEYDIQAKELTKVTYAELKELRDNGGLVAGHLYRITDYEFTTKKSIDSYRAGHVFDIIVLATAENQLSELARAIQHEGDTYFDGNDLGAWELWYDLDNDTDKYDWADTTNGKGVIYRMIDERGNDCPYDFKNAKMYVPDLVIGIKKGWYLYTFAYVVDGIDYDGSVDKRTDKLCHDNVMAARELNGRKVLNDNVLYNTSISGNCYGNTFKKGCYKNVLGEGFGSNAFGFSSHDNTLLGGCYRNAFGDYSSGNSLKNSCYGNTFGGETVSNVLENNCNANTLMYGCVHNRLYKCEGNTLDKFVTDQTLSSLNTVTITLNDEYFDDGSGQLVPIKHPDLSTQPSILPYKFAGNYVYEQLIPTSSMAADLDDKLILSAEAAGKGKAKAVGVKCAGGVLTASEDVSGYKWIRVVYTSMPEDGGYYYGYGDELPHYGIVVYNTSDAISVLLKNAYNYDNGVELSRIGENLFHYEGNYKKDSGFTLRFVDVDGHGVPITNAPKVYANGNTYCGDMVFSATQDGWDFMLAGNAVATNANWLLIKV